jgi:hypothetical protein
MAHACFDFSLKDAYMEPKAMRKLVRSNYTKYDI